MWTISKILSIFLITAVVSDILLVFRFKGGLQAKRLLKDKLSNSDANEIKVELFNHFPFKIGIRIIDELPFQFQMRDFQIFSEMSQKTFKSFSYSVTPKERGVYRFGSLNVYVCTVFKIVERRFKFDTAKEVAVYPSYLQMKKYEFLAMNHRLTQFGLKRIRRIGHTMEFEQIKNYVSGDDVRTINWKATAKKAELMVNQYQDEKSQPIYSIIDVGRVMKMPFNQLSLLDYSINATLAFSNIALLKNDKAGMMTSSRQIDNRVVASNKKSNLRLINETLYNISTKFLDSDFDLLYATVKREVKQRSLLILYTNFEHMSALQRVLSNLKALSRDHLLLVVFFKNTELDKLSVQKSKELREIYESAVAQKFSYDKKIMVNELRKHGIHALLTDPKELSVQVINQYLQFKSRGII